MISSTASLYKSIFDALRGAGSWGNRVFSDLASTTTTRPYVVFFILSGVEPDFRKSAAINYQLTVKAVSTNLSEAMQCSQEILATLNNKGAQDGGSIIGDETWQINTIKQTSVLHQIETLVDAKPLYNAGHVFSIIMEEMNGYSQR